MMDYTCKCGHVDTKHFAPGSKCLGSHGCQCRLSRNAVLVEGMEQTIAAQAAEIERLKALVMRLSEEFDTIANIIAGEYPSTSDSMHLTANDARKALQTQESK